MLSFLNSSEPSFSSSSSSSSLTSSSLPRLAPTSPATTSAALAVVPTFRVHPSLSSLAILTTKPTTIPFSYSSTTYPPKHFRSRFRNYYSNSEPTFSDRDENGDYSDVSDSETIFDDGGGLSIQIEKLGTNSRRIYSRIGIDAPLQAVWNILTDYERLADFIPGLAISQILFKIDNHVRLFQVGEQNLAFGLKFNAKGTIDCYENDLERLPFGKRRVIKFKMIEGDFELFEGEWSIEQFGEDDDSFQDQEIHSTLSYSVDVKPKLLLPVRLLEGRLCGEIKANLVCIREEVHKTNSTTP
ncbi:uncharacterized protein LOC101204838 [Cucumis sativus]|uniref:Coenzyme Q-binding protein COQ10 START domain-containing protein n=1 Tax=Cucumis sativus TaxID=3659 RepID=A0A0A0KCX4_CUCSA|nr:uncharacterized protein LOC101204838 [Cucumis sativus]KGN45631.1 hypothetical protein Csa_005331 [Cucumis sativus]